jgi:hypothetical protein
MNMLRRHWFVISIFLLSIIALAIVVSVWSTSNHLSPDQTTKETIPSFIKTNSVLNQSIEPPSQTTDIRKEQLQDGSTVEFGTHNGPLTPERLKELRSIVTTKPQSSLPSSFSFIHTAQAADIVDSIVVDNQSQMAPNIDAQIKDLFRTRKFIWTEADLSRLSKIIIVQRKEDLGGALGVYDYVLIRGRKGAFKDWKGIIYLWAQTDLGVTLSHEYGHHFTNFWAAHRTQGTWGNVWPADEAGNYYTLRPMPAVCSCNTDACPYQLRIWEILAEDFRATVSEFPDGHIFAEYMCSDGSRKVGLPNNVEVGAYLRALPIPLTPTPEDTDLTIRTTSTTLADPTLLPSITLTPTPTPTTGPCEIPEPARHSIQLGSWYPCK